VGHFLHGFVSWEGLVYLVRFFALLFLCLCVGCDDSSPPTLPSPLPPLTVEEWKTLPVEEKYDEGTFDRLREQDPKLKGDREWARFMKEVVVLERKIDIPGVPGQPHSPAP
jgi:hypothetical protein